VSDVQEAQMASMGDNILAIAVDGTFDDCQRLVKTAFADDDLRQHVWLTPANSINLGRLLPQVFYYFPAVGPGWRARSIRGGAER
jgi:threonine synthase